MGEDRSPGGIGRDLTADQRARAVVSEKRIDLVLGPGQDGKTIQSEGLLASQMTTDQQAALFKLIGHYTGLANDTTAAARLAERLRLSNDLRDRLVAAMGQTPRITSWMSPREIRRAIYQIGARAFADRVKLAWAGAARARPAPVAHCAASDSISGLLRSQSSNSPIRLEGGAVRPAFCARSAKGKKRPWLSMQAVVWPRWQSSAT